MMETLGSGTISTKLARIAELARSHPERVFNSLHHVIDTAWLREAYDRTRKDAAAGVDGLDAEDYKQHLEGNLENLLERFRAGTYRAPPVRRVHIPKGDGRTRPIGVPTFEDKILQRAVAMVLEAIYEQDFRPVSFGFRPGRGQHDALDTLWSNLMRNRGWVLEVDIEGFFDAIDHDVLRGFLDKRVGDGKLRRMINKWLKAGVVEEGEWKRMDEGTPQGGVISPLLANVYLHEVVDRWFEDEVQPRMKGRAYLVRYADDLVIGFDREDDAKRVMEVLPQRFGKYGLTLHPDKTRLMKFVPRQDGGDDDDEPRTFNFLGLTHYWGRSRKGNWVVKVRTMRSRFARALGVIHEWCKQHRHHPVWRQRKELASKLRGHYAYYGLKGNIDSLQRFAYAVRRTWRNWLDRRSQRARMSWERFNQLLLRFPLPKPRIMHRQLRLDGKFAF